LSATVYAINKGINQPVEFKGFQAQYIWYLGSGLLFLLILFAVLYISGFHPFFCLGFILLSGSAFIFFVSRLSHKYGEHGLMKQRAKGKVPKVIASNSRKLFTDIRYKGKRK
jgi:hypothetical protein